MIEEPKVILMSGINFGKQWRQAQAIVDFILQNSEHTRWTFKIEGCDRIQELEAELTAEKVWHGHWKAANGEINKQRVRVTELEAVIAAFKSEPICLAFMKSAGRNVELHERIEELTAALEEISMHCDPSGFPSKPAEMAAKALKEITKPGSEK